MLCCVCQEPVEESASAVCDNCGRRYHLNLRQDRQAKDCGTVWLNEESLTLEFACFVCLGRQAPAGDVEEPPLGRGH